MKEDYIVKFATCPGGHWFVEEEDVEVEVECTEEKCNHDLAKAVIEKKYKGAVVVNVSYC